MRAFADQPIRRKLSLAFMATIMVVVAVAGAAFFAYEYVASRRSFRQSIITNARITADNSTAAVAFGDADGAGQILSALRGESQVLRAVLYNGSGDRLAAYLRSGEPEAPARLPEVDGTRFEGGRLLCVLPVEEGNRRMGTLYLEATLSRVYARWAAYGVVVLAVTTGATIVAWLFGISFQRRIAGPIVELAETAREVTSARNYALRAQVYGRDELGELARSFNNMLAEIQAGLAAQERTAAEIRTLNAQLEQRVRERTHQLEAANRELESFSYSVSHDLRAPLRHVQGYAEMLVRSSAGTLSDKCARYAQTIINASGEMGQLIDDLLTFSRMGRTELREAEVDLAALVDDVRRGLELAVRDRAIEWDVASLPPVRGDVSLLKLVLTNLISNAVKFTRTRSPARISIGCSGTENGRTIIHVRDNGVGFDMAYYDKLFGVFQRLHRVEEFEGTGIGLANVQRIISRHGGRVWAEGQPEIGATFFFTLKSVPAAAPASRT